MENMNYILEIRILIFEKFYKQFETISILLNQKTVFFGLPNKRNRGKLQVKVI